MKKTKMKERNNNKEGSYNSPINLISFPFLSNFLSLSLSSLSPFLYLNFISVHFDEETDGSYARRVGDGGFDGQRGGGGASSTPQTRRNGRVRESTSVTVGFSSTKVETRRWRLVKEGNGFG